MTGVQVAMTTRWLAGIGAAIVVAAIVLLLAPLHATYINDVGSDTIEMRSASCGAPVATLVGVEPGVGGGSVHRLGRAGPRAVCDAAVGKRVSGALLLLLAVSTGGWFVAVRRR